MLHKNDDPHEILQHYKFFMQVMSPTAKKLYRELLSLSKEEFYDPMFLRKEKPPR